MNAQADKNQLTMPFDAGTRQVWRPIHYLGSKLRLTDSIRGLLSNIDPNNGTVCDLFAGSGTVALALSADRTVVAADIQEYSRVLCTALLAPAPLSQQAISSLMEQAERGDVQARLEASVRPILDYEAHALAVASLQPELLCDLVERCSLVGNCESKDALGLALADTRSRIERDGTRDYLMATRYFGGTYFSFRQALFIDQMLEAIGHLPQTLRDTCRAALLSTASNVVNTIGKHFAQPIRPRHKDGSLKRHIIKRLTRDRRLSAASQFSTWLTRYSVLPTSTGHRVIRGDFRDVLSQLSDIAVIYADPPYTRDHYSRFYHVLETLCLRDCPDVSTTSLNGRGPTSRGVYRTDRHQSPFCIKSQAPAAFDDLFAGARRLGAPILLSYSPFIKDGHPRLMTVDAIVQLAENYFPKVELVHAQGMTHSKLNKSELHLDASDNAEVFIVCQD